MPTADRARQDGAPGAYMGATHASHGLTREGQHRTASRRSLRSRIYGGPWWAYRYARLGSLSLTTLLASGS